MCLQSTRKEEEAQSGREQTAEQENGAGHICVPLAQPGMGPFKT